MHTTDHAPAVFINPRFPLGTICATPGALDLVDGEGQALTPFISRHVCGDWGDLEDEDKQANEIALEIGDRIFSCYHINGEKIYIITSHCRTETTILLPIEY